MVRIYDTTLRDGLQREGVSLTVEDRLRIVKKLDALGIPLIEGGYPASNAKEAEFFEKAHALKLDQARLVAFGSRDDARGKPPDGPGFGVLSSRRRANGSFFSRALFRWISLRP